MRMCVRSKCLITRRCHFSDLVAMKQTESVTLPYFAKNAKIFACHYYMDVIFWNKDIELNYHHLRFKAVFHPMAFHFSLSCDSM